MGANGAQQTQSNAICPLDLETKNEQVNYDQAVNSVVDINSKINKQLSVLSYIFVR